MQIFLNPLAYISYFFITALHFAAPMLPPLGEKILKYVNVALHVAFYFVMMLCRIPLNEAVLLYLLSLLLYLLSALLWHKLKKKDMREAAGKEGEV
jgi:hypothetical protein